MSPRIRKAAAVLSATALLGGGAVGIAQAASGDAGTRPGRSGLGPGPGPMSGASLAKIAAALGVTTAQLQAAMEATRPAPPTGARPRGAAGMASELATALGVSTARVKAALDKIEAAHRAEHTAHEAAMYSALAAKLGLSADAVKAAFEANRPAKPAAAA